MKTGLLFTTFTATRYAMHRNYVFCIISRLLLRTICDLRFAALTKTARGTLPVDSNKTGY